MGEEEEVGLQNHMLGQEKKKLAEKRDLSKKIIELLMTKINGKSGELDGVPNETLA